LIGQMLSRGASPVRTAQLSYYLRRFSVDSDDYLPKPKQWNKDPFHVEQKPRVTAQPQHAESVVPYPVLPGPNPYINPLYKRPNLRPDGHDRGKINLPKGVRYKSIMDLELPLSSLDPPGGHPESWIWNHKLQKVGITKLSPDMFNQSLRKDVLHRIVVYERNKGRGFSGVRVKNRAEVRGSTRKVRPQKGTGFARMSDKYAPHIRGGGKAHGRRPKDFSIGCIPKVRDMSLKVALSARWRQGDLIIWDNYKFPSSSKESADKLKQLWGWWNVCFIFRDNFDQNLAKATLEYDEMQPINVKHLTTISLLKYKKIVIDLAALRYLERRYSAEWEVRWWNEAASINRLAQELEPDAFPEDGEDFSADFSLGEFNYDDYIGMDASKQPHLPNYVPTNG